MRIALSGTELAPTEPVEHLLEQADRLGIPFVEIWYPRNFATGVDATIAALRASRASVACISTGSELYRHGGSLEDQQLLLQAIELAGRLGAPIVNTYFGYDDVMDDERAIAAYARLLEPCLVQAPRHGVTIVLENEFNAFGVDPAGSDVTRRPLALRRLFETVADERFRLNFDAANFYCAGVEPYPYSYELLAPFIGYAHVKDAARYDAALGTVDPMPGWQRFTDNHHEYVMRPLGDGAVPWSALLQRMKAANYAGFLTLEPHAERAGLSSAWEHAVAYVRAFL
jgi:sugar phosphate isomerase/epimerase